MADLKSITAYARTFLGSHYLWGSAGAFPGQLNGTRYRPGSVAWNEASLRLSELSLCAAKCDVQGHYVCAGRFQKAGGLIVPQDDVALHDFLAQYGSAALAQWDSVLLRLTPRLVRGAGVPAAGKIVWGENCGGSRHFDCISFINFVLTQTTRAPDQKLGWNASIEQWSRMWTTNVPLNDPSVAGDILFRYSEDEKGKHFHHIAFLDDNGYVVQAEMASAGVHADELYRSSKWQIRRRLEDQYVLPDRSNYA